MRTIITTLCSLLITTCVYAQSQYQRIDPWLYGGVNINAVSICNTRWVACGERATIVRYDAGIMKPVPVPVGDTIMFNDIVGLASGEVVAVGTNGCIVRSQDYGATFIHIQSGTLENLEAVALDNAGNGVVVGSNGTVLYSTNSGVTWTAVNSRTVLSLHDVCSVPDGTFAVVGDEGALGIIDAMGVLSLRSGNPNLPFHSIVFFDKNTGLVGSTGIILKTRDGGTTWAESYSSFDGTITCLDNDKDVVVACGGTQGFVLYSTNAGTLWRKSNVLSDSATYRGALANSVNSTAIVCGDDGTISQYLFSGLFVAFGSQYAPFFFDIHAASNDEMWGVGSNQSVYKYTSAGVWDSQTVPVPSLPSSVAINGDETVLCVGFADGGAMYTKDEGENWDWCLFDGLPPISSMSYAQQFYCAGVHDVYSSVNAESWTRIGSFPSNNVFDVNALSNTTAVICGSNGLVASTINNGTSWQTHVTGITESLMDGVVDSELNGVFVGQLGVALQTLDKGTSFTRIDLPNVSTMVTAVEGDPKTGRLAMCTIDGKILYRNARGSKFYIANVEMQLNDVALLSDNTLIAVGEGGAVYKIDLHVLSVDEQVMQSLVVAPNPANTVVQIEVPTEFIEPWLTIVQSTGEIVMSRSLSNVTALSNIDIHHLASGSYTIVVSDVRTHSMSRAQLTIQR